MGAAGGVEGVRGALSLSRCNARTAIFFPSFFFFFFFFFHFNLSLPFERGIDSTFPRVTRRGITGARSNIKRICGRSVDFRAGCLIASRVGRAWNFFRFFF